MEKQTSRPLSTPITRNGEISDASISAPPVIILQADSQREISNLHPPSSGSATGSTKRPKRPFGGIVTFAILLLTAGLIGIFLPKETRRIALIIYTPIYCTCFLAYILYLCCVNNEGEEDEYDPEPAVLREYLIQKKKNKSKRGKISRRKRKKIVSSNKEETNMAMKGHPLTVASTLSLETDEIINQHNPIDNNIEIVETSESIQPSQSTETTEQSLLTTTFPNFFQEVFPGVSKNFESIEVEFHNLATKVKHRIRPPHQCHICQSGIHGMEGQNVFSTVCRHGHQAHDEKNHYHHHRHHRDEFQRPQTDVENYMPDDYDYTVGDDASFDTSLTTHDHDPRFYLEEIPMKVNLTGKYKLVHNHNFDAFLKTQNVPMLLRKAANASKPIHTITHEGNMLRIQVDGIVRGDTTFEIDGPTAESNIRYLKFDDHVTWVDNGQAVEVRKVARNAPNGGAVELVVKRTLGNGKHNLVLSSKARFENGDESLESVQTFHRIG